MKFGVFDKHVLGEIQFTPARALLMYRGANILELC